MGTAYKIPRGIPSRVRVVSFPANTVLQYSPYEFTGQYFFNFLLIFIVNLDW